MPEKQATIKPTGSFMSAASIKDTIDSKRAAEEINKAQDDTEKAKLKLEEENRVKEIEALLPKMVLSSFGEISYSAFKTAYSQVWDQIREKDHLAVGYCFFSGELLPGVKGTLRTLRARESRAVTRWAPASDMRGLIQDMEQDVVYRHIKLAIGLTAFDGRALPDMPELKSDNAEAWLKIPIVEQKMNWLDSLPEEVTAQLSGLHLDLSNAMRFALRENLKNLSAPPAHS